MRRHFVSRFLEPDDGLEIIALSGRYDEQLDVTVNASGQPVLAAGEMTQAPTCGSIWLSTTKSFDTDTRQAPAPDAPPDLYQRGLATSVTMDIDTKGGRDQL